MAISKWTWKRVPTDADGKIYDSLETFQAAEIRKLIGDDPARPNIFDEIVQNKAEIIEILELTYDARPRSRGVKKPRKPKAGANAPEPKRIKLLEKTA